MCKICALTDSQKQALKWWADELSINDMKHLTKKYFPVFSWTYVNQIPSWIEEIYNAEKETYKTYPQIKTQ